VEIRKLMSILVTLELQGYIREITKNYYIRIK
jgi:DNA processing protein